MRSWVEELKKEIKKDVYEKRPTSPIDHCVFEEDSQKPLQSFIEIANEHKDKKTLKQQREEIFLDIAIKEKELLEKYTDIKIKYYDWETGQHVNPNSIILFTSIIKERIRELDRVILEGMSTKDFKHLYGGIDSTGILSISPNLVSSTFAQDVVTKGVEATTHQFGSEFPGAFIHSIGDFDPQSYSKVDAQATASWDSTQTLGPDGWEPLNSDEYTSSVSDVAAFGQETTSYKDIYYGEVHLNGDKLTIHTGDDADDRPSTPPEQDSTIDIADLRTLFPGVSFPQSLVSPGAADQDDPDPEDTAPIQASMLLRTFKNVRENDRISFKYSFDSLETEEDDDVTYRGETRPVPGDDANMDDYVFVIVGDEIKGKLVSVLAKDGNNLDFNFVDNGEGVLKPDVLQGRFPLTGDFQYTVTLDDIDDYGNLKFFIGVMDCGDTVYQSTVDITNFKNLDTRTAAGDLGKTTDAFDLGYKAYRDLSELESQLDKKTRELRKKLKDKYDYEYTENDGWMEDFEKGGKTADAISNLLTIGLSLIAAKALIATIGPAAAATVTKGAKVLDRIGKWWNKGKNERIPNEDTADLKTLWQDEMQQLTRSDAAFQAGKTGLDGWNPFKAFSPKMVKTGPSPAVRQAGRIFKPGITPGATAGGEMQRESYNFLSEQVDTDDKFIKQMAKTLDKIKKPAELEKMVEFMKAASKAKEKQELRKGNQDALYPGQPSPNGFPDAPPPAVAPNGYHPEFGKRSDRYRRLDPVSAVVMNRVKTDDPETNKQVAAAAKKSKLKSVKEFKKGLTK